MLEKPYFLTDTHDQDKRFDTLEASHQESILSLRNHGYCMIDMGLNDDFLDQIITDCKSEYEKVEYGGAGRSRIENAFSFSDNARQLALHPKMMEFLRIAFGREPIPFQTLNFDKGSEQATHSDTVHFNSYPYGFMCGAWIALEDIDENNGPLHYYPGSHKLPIFGLEQFSMHGSANPPSYDLYPNYEKGVQELIKSIGLEKVSVRMKKGECLIWAANLLHGGDPIKDTSRTRHSQVNHYFFEDCFYYTPMLSSPFKGDFHLRNPMNIVDGKEIGMEKVKEYALKAGIDIDQFSKGVQTEKKSILQRIFC